jgi:hypothetical protein
MALCFAGRFRTISATKSATVYVISVVMFLSPDFGGGR